MTRKNSTVGLLLALAAGTLPAIATAAGPFQYHAVTPCRVFDSRTDAGGTVGAPDAMIVKGINHLRIQGSCGIPVGARAVTINVTVISTQGAGHITLWPDDGTEPVVSTLNYLPGEPALANGAIVPIRLNATLNSCPLKTPSDAPDPDCDLSFRYVRQSSPTPSDAGHIAFDVTGYFI
jgi:hypothetical protein